MVENNFFQKFTQKDGEINFKGAKDLFENFLKFHNTK